MSNVSSAPAWQSYKVGTVVTVADGREFTITNIEEKKTKGGYSSRLFTLAGPNGETVVKTSRGLTLWQAGKSGDGNADVAVEEAERAAVRDTYSDTPSGKSLAEIIAEAVAATGLVTAEAGAGGIDEEAVTRIVNERIAALLPQRIEVARVDGSVSNVGVQHSSFEALLRIVAQRVNVWLPGPAGSGKTSAAHAVAEALTLPFYAVSVGPQTSQSQLLGYYDANGKYVTTQLRQAYEHGGVFLLDEVDAGSPAVLVTINALLANGHASFPDAVVERHKDFVLIAAGNTYGQGADRQYVGRQQLDAATLDRFAVLDWEYDSTLEAHYAGLPLDVFDGLPKAKSWKFLPVDDAANVQARSEEYAREAVKVRRAVAGFGKALRLLIGPRSTYTGLALVRAGFRVQDVLELVVWKGADKDTRSKVEAAAKSL
jgi:hypothetical protein